MQCWSTLLGYNLLIKSKQYTKTQFLISNISYANLCEVAEAVQSTNTYIHLSIFAIKCQVQLVTTHVSHSYAKCYQYKLWIYVVIVTKRMPSFWATFNLFDLWCSIVLWLAGVDFGFFESTTLAFCYTMAIMNLVAVATFFYKTYKRIFDYLLAV